MKAGDVVHMKSFTHSEPGMSVGYKANSDKVAVFLLLGHAPRKTPGEFDPTDALKRLGWQLDAPADPTDELGKVWDVLHAAGINSGGELSASEGVKLLVDKLFEASLTTIQLDDHSAQLQELTGVLAGMLFEFDDGVNGGHDASGPAPVLEYARKLVDAKQWAEQ